MDRVLAETKTGRIFDSDLLKGCPVRNSQGNRIGSEYARAIDVREKYAQTLVLVGANRRLLIKRFNSSYLMELVLRRKRQ